MTTQDFLSRYHWTPADTDDRLDWLVMVSAAWMLYAVAGVGCLLWRM